MPLNRAINAILEITNRVPGITRAFLLYRFIQLLSLPVVALYFVARLLTSRAYQPHFVERLGILPRSFSRTKPGAIWFHAVSVGEVASSIPLIRNMRAEQPLLPIFLSTSTPAGRQAALRQASDLVSGIFYAPVDYVSCVRRCLRVLRPALVVVLETEIWPNLYREARAAGAGLAIVNGRISNKSWPRYRGFRWFFSPILKLPDLVFTQTATDEARYLELGTPAERLRAGVNLKYDAVARAETPANALPDFKASHVWIAASTVGPNERGSAHKHRVDEDDLVLAAFQRLATEFPQLLVILAPRQPSRFEEVARKLEKANISHIRRTVLTSERDLALPGVLLLDTIGELAGLYPLADAVFVGGSIAPRGGHNIIEPAGAGAAIVIGPHMHNFESIANDFLGARAVLQIQTADDLLPTVRNLLADRARAREFGRRARHVVSSHRGAASAIARELWALYFASTPRPVHNLLVTALLRALARLWIWGGHSKRRREQQYAFSVRPLPVPVISVGSLTVGGAGKTPFTSYLASRLRQKAYSPGILTRGYRRRSPASAIILAAGASIPAGFTGDEAQIFLRAAHTPLGIGSNRYQCAQILLRQFPETDVLVLDDGFQHARLQRTLDIVLIDGLDPFGQEDVVPLGRLREPLSALGRADVLVVTRAENDLRYRAISARLGELNPRAPVFRTRFVVRGWRDAEGTRISPPVGRVAAFCGLGNPENFWRTLESLGLDVVFRWEFDDHHAYKPFELKRVAHQGLCHGAEMVVTTEKDWINCPPHVAKTVAPLTLAWLEIELQIEDEPRFLAVVETALRKTRPFPLAR
ncbi:MAG: tetraacyldisaccharide 4'-kinase [Acidobacteriaceae bacterium]|nr:tetraacyldisaccharide 4'-kinase [Acidobacteriaceae bacterium]